MEKHNYDLGAVFNVAELQGQTIEGYKEATTFVPDDEPGYQFSLELLCDLMAYTYLVLQDAVKVQQSRCFVLD